MDSAKVKEKLVLARKEGRRLGYWRHGYGYPHYAKQIFRNSDLSGKTMLEIGCGSGIYCIWAAIQGASHVVGLEPLVEGSFDTPKCFTNFAQMVDALDLCGAEIKPLLLQEFQAPANYFDVVLSLASINHLDEKSCINLRKDAGARNSYLAIFAKIAGMMRMGGKLILVDCSAQNLFAERGLKNIFSPTIEWFKHQPPEVWTELLGQCGFSDIQISWTSGSVLRYLGIYSIPKVLSYCLGSTFRLECTFVGSESRT